jgi:hypothetical protein
MGKKKEPKKIEPAEAYKIVTETELKINRIVMRSVRRAHPSQRWLLAARIVNLAFGRFYTLSMNAIPPDHRT